MCLLTGSPASFIYLQPALSFFHPCLSLSGLLGLKWPHLLWKCSGSCERKLEEEEGIFRHINCGVVYIWHGLSVLFLLSALQVNCRYSWYCGFHMILCKWGFGSYPYPARVQYLRVRWRCDKSWPLVYLWQSLLIHVFTLILNLTLVIM